MTVRVQLVVAAALLFTVGCSPEAPESSADGTWIGTITTEDNVTTVVNESGSVWGGTATLVEEMSIGVESGDPVYMLGPGAGVWDSGDRILYPDASVPTVLVYEGNGRHLGDVGRQGQGPGEYTFPYAAAMLDDGRIVVTNAESGWIDLFDRNFAYIERWGPYPDDLTAPGASLNHALVVGTDGTLYLNYREWPPNSGDITRGWRAIGPAGLGPVIWDPVFDFEPLRNCYRPDCSLYGSIRFSPGSHRAFLPNGNLVGGLSDDYSFEIRHPDGSLTVVRQRWEPVRLSEEEWSYWVQRRRAEALLRSADWAPGWSDEVPRHKPAFSRFLAARDGGFLVMREGPSRRIDSCTEDPLANIDSEFVPCWEGAQILDFFAADGRFMGEIQAPRERLRGAPHIVDDWVTVAVEDEAGTIMVKRYRLVLPGEVEQ